MDILSGSEAFAPVCCYDHASEARRISFYIVCSICGNKRCPHSTNCSLPCTGLNEMGQEGSRYRDWTKDSIDSPKEGDS